MKKIALVTLVILALLVSMLPLSSAMAASAAKSSVGTSTVFIRNQTGAPVTIRLMNAAGAMQQFSLPTGSYYMTFPAYTYSFVANTSCGNRYGSLNLTRKAVLYFSCKPGEQVVLSTIVPAAVADPCHLYGYLWSGNTGTYSPTSGSYYNTWGCADGKTVIGA